MGHHKHRKHLLAVFFFVQNRKSVVTKQNQGQTSSVHQIVHRAVLREVRNDFSGCKVDMFLDKGKGRLTPSFSF